jgi:hypothetical protein
MILLTSVLRPAWQTPKGDLGSFAQSIAIAPITLVATNTSRYEILSGSLPNPLRQIEYGDNHRPPYLARMAVLI